MLGERERETNCRRCQKYTDKVNLRLAQSGKKRRLLAKQERGSRRGGRNRSSPRKTPCVCCSLRGAFDVQQADKSASSNSNSNNIDNSNTATRALSAPALPDYNRDNMHAHTHNIYRHSHT